MKKFRLIYDVIILIVVLLGFFKLFTQEYYLAFIWIILTPILMLLPRNLYKIKYIKDNYNSNLIFIFEIFVLILLFMTVSYNLYFGKLNIDFDSFSHFVNLVIYTLIIGIVYYIFNSREYKYPSKTSIALFAFFMALIFGVLLWEKFQFYNDKIFGTLMYYDKFQDIRIDTLYDQIFGSLGTILGSILLYNKIESWMKSWRK